MAHGNTVTYGNGREDNGRAARFCDTHLNRFGNFVEVHVARDNFIVRADNTDERFAELLFCQAECVVKGAVRSIVKTVNNSIFNHSESPKD